MRGLQFNLSKQIYNSRLKSFLDSDNCTNADLVRLASCRHKSTLRWSHPSFTVPTYTDLCTSMVVRLRTGLPPIDDMPAACLLCDDCPDLRLDPWHALSCTKLKRTKTTVRHDGACNLLCQFARSNDLLAHVVKKDLAHLLPDGEILMARRCVLFDLSGVNPHTSSYIDLPPGGAMSERERYKESKYRAHCVDLGSSFSPFVIDSYGCLGPAALQLLKDIQEESLTSFSPPAPYHLSRSAFLARLSSQWQLDNAKIAVQWLTMMRVATRRFQIHVQSTVSSWPMDDDAPGADAALA